MHTQLDGNMFTGCMFICLHAWISGCLHTHMLGCLCAHMLICLRACMLMYLHTHLFICSITLLWSLLCLWLYVDSHDL